MLFIIFLFLTNSSLLPNNVLQLPVNMSVVFTYFHFPEERAFEKPTEWLVRNAWAETSPQEQATVKAQRCPSSSNFGKLFSSLLSTLSLHIRPSPPPTPHKFPAASVTIQAHPYTVFYPQSQWAHHICGTQGPFLLRKERSQEKKKEGKKERERKGEKQGGKKNRKKDLP